MVWNGLGNKNLKEISSLITVNRAKCCLIINERSMKNFGRNDKN